MVTTIKTHRNVIVYTEVQLKKPLQSTDTAIDRHGRMHATEKDKMVITSQPKENDEDWYTDRSRHVLPPSQVFFTSSFWSPFSQWTDGRTLQRERD